MVFSFHNDYPSLVISFIRSQLSFLVCERIRTYAFHCHYDSQELLIDIYPITPLESANRSRRKVIVEGEDHEDHVEGRKDGCIRLLLIRRETGGLVRVRPFPHR